MERINNIMAGKNHRRYKMRKCMNEIKHKPVSLFNEPPVLISTWEELSKLETETHSLVIDVDGCNGHVRPKFKLSDDDDYYMHNAYLSTHTFYSSQYFESTAMLRKLGFNVQLQNWDGETVYCKY